MKRIRFWIFIILVQWAPASIDIPDLPDGMTVSEALYINCLQRTQTQQLLKEYLQIALNMAHGSFRKTFTESVEQYGRRLKQLNDFFLPKLDAEHQKSMTDAAAIWEVSRQLLLAPPSQTNSQKLDDNFHKMIALLGKAKVLAHKRFRAVGLTGGMCRDPLYVTNIYLMKLYGVAIPDSKEKMRKRLNHFEHNMEALQQYPGNTEAIKKHLSDARESFTFFLYMYDSDTTFVPTLIARKADAIFQSIRSIKKLYGQITDVTQ